MATVAAVNANINTAKVTGRVTIYNFIILNNIFQ